MFDYPARSPDHGGTVRNLQPRLPLDRLLYDTTFVVVDLETTGLRPGVDRITEVGAVKACRGDVLGELSTLVHPRRPIPGAITAITGINDMMVRGAPAIEAVLPTLLEFCGDAVFVAHNARFDVAFLNAELDRLDYPRLSMPVVDTAALARRLLHDEVRSMRLDVLAGHLRARTRPQHRALPDARATLDVLHALMERAGSLGAMTVEDVQDLCRSSSQRAFRKRDLVRDAPSRPGVYRFVDARGQVLYVGTSRDLRSRLRAYFGQDRRRRIADLVRETERVEWTVCPTSLEASVRELREIRQHRPRFNRRSTLPGREVSIKLTVEPFPRLSIVARVTDERALHIGPLASRRTAERFVEAAQGVLGLRACSLRLRVRQDHPACVLKELGRCGGPCDGSQTRHDYAAIVEAFRTAVDGDCTSLLSALRQRMQRLAGDRRYERAADLRRQLHVVAQILWDVRRHHALVKAAELAVVRPATDGLEAALIRHGRLVTTVAMRGGADEQVLSSLHATAKDQPGPATPTTPDREEVRILLGWLEQPDVRLIGTSGVWAWPVAGGHDLAAAVDESRKLDRTLRHDHQLLEGAKVVRRPIRIAAT